MIVFPIGLPRVQVCNRMTPAYIYFEQDAPVVPTGWLIRNLSYSDFFLHMAGANRSSTSCSIQSIKVGLELTPSPLSNRGLQQLTIILPIDPPQFPLSNDMALAYIHCKLDGPVIRT